MKVKYAVQIFSNIVVSIINTYVSCDKLPPTAIHTAKFLLQFDRIFDRLNSSCLKAKNEYISAISSSSVHSKFFPEFIRYLNRCTVKSDRQPPCLNRLKLNINSVTNLWNDLEKNFNITELKTRRLNQDSLENLFSIVHQKNGCNDMK